MGTTTSTRTSAETARGDSALPGAARVVAAAGPHGAVLAELRAAAPWAPRPLPAAAGVARVALSQTTAALVAGDAVALDVVVEAGAALELIETGATVAHDARGGPAASVHVRMRLGAGARLRWLAQPLVLAGGCVAERSCEIALAPGAHALLRETLVLGRSGEQPGRLRSHLHATHAGRPLLVEQLDTTDLALLRSPVVAGDATVLDAVYLLGTHGEDLPGASQLHGPGTVWRALAPRSADPDAAAAPIVAAWATALRRTAPRSSERTSPGLARA
jgi:urease accessory protein